MPLQDEAQKLADLIRDFRAFEHVAISPDSVLRWVYQFDDEYREATLLAMRGVLAEHYINAAQAQDYLLTILESERLTAGNPIEYWSSTHLLGGQVRGSSQRLLIAAFTDLARQRFGAGFQFAGHLAERAFYLDDFLLSGGRLKEDFTRWADMRVGFRAPSHLDIGFFGVHALGEYFFDNYVRDRYARSGLTYKIRRIRTYENRKARRNSSSVFWPSITARSVGYPQFDAAAPVLRVPPGAISGLWSEAGRALLEHQLLKAGCRIAESMATRMPSMKPLGFYNLGYGFGAICSSHLNCPNNAPLALWWTARTQGLPQGWHALLPRRTND